jgi:hypothetical protein
VEEAGVNVDVAGGLVVLVVLALAIGAFVFWVWALVDVIKTPDDGRFRAGNQLVWVLVIVFTQVIGALIYVLVGRPEPQLRR